MSSSTEEAARALEADHTPEAVRARLDGGAESDYLRDLVFGGVDGAVTTFAIAAGAVGAGLGAGAILVLGLANLLADGFSMGASNYLGTRADEERAEQIRREEERHIELLPEGEREEIRQIFARKGFDGADLERAVAIVTADRTRWVETMLREEHGLPLAVRSARRAAVATFVAFAVVGALPLLPFLVEVARSDLLAGPFALSAVLTGLAFFAIGALKARVVDRSWLRSGLETFAIGSAAASAAFFVGLALRGLVES